MSAQNGAIVAAGGSVVRGIFGKRLVTFAGIVAASITLGACTVPTASLLGADPADPGAKVASAGYRSTVAPYSSLRPTTPVGWREQNQSVTPSLKSQPEH